MEIIIHGHQTEVTDSLKVRAKESVEKLNDRLGRIMTADVRFEEDGVMKTAEIILEAPQNIRLVAKGENKYHEVALTDAVAKLDAQIRKLKSARKRQVHPPELRA